MSAHMVTHEHITALLDAGLRRRRPDGPLHWEAPHEREPTDYAVGQPWGPTAVENAQRHRRILDHDTAGGVGTMLLAENRRSVDHLYAEDGIEPDDAYEYPRSPISVPARRDPVHVLSLISGYEYQACEHAEWQSSEAHAFCHALRARMIRSLPGYDDAPWTL